MALKSFVSSSRILFFLLPGLGSMILIRLAIHWYRPDIEDAEHRARDYPFEKLYDCYDFIIVGGGSAGSVLANRLSENKNWTVLLLEAGSDENVLSEVPVLFPILQTSMIDWQFVTESSDSFCLSMVDHRCKWPRGKVLGGSSALNAMLYIRGNKRDYDKWASMGNTGWSFKDVFPYFLKAEDMRIPHYQNDPYHSTGGPLTVEYFKYEHPITRDILEAGRQLGYEIRDVNGEYQTGFTRSHATVREGLRCSAAKAYLRPASKRPNLHISVFSLVQKILVNGKNNVYGVEFIKMGKERIVRAKREVILSAGAIQSPQLLMLSGIGPAQHLEEIGIHPVVDSPGVGQNLQDHIAMGGHSYIFDNPNQNGTDYCFNLLSVMSVGNLIDFAIHHKGTLYSMMEAEAMAFVKSKYADPMDDYPDIQLFIAPTADNMDGGLFGKRANGLTDECYAELYENILYDSSFSVVPLLLRPKSRGYLKLRDSNPNSPPLIYPNYFSHPDDMKVMIEGARIVQALTEQPVLKKLNARPNPNRNPGCSKSALMSDEHLECQARHHSLTIYHPVGTCAMGPAADPNAVVDSRLRVYGVKNLRVVDGSVMPEIVNGNTNAPIIMIAEKASDMIKEDWYEYEDYPTKGCTPEQYDYPQQRNLEEKLNEPQKVHLNQRTFDAVNETTNMFTNLAFPKLNKMDQDWTKMKTNPYAIFGPKYETKTKKPKIKTLENQEYTIDKINNAIYEDNTKEIQPPSYTYLPSQPEQEYNPSIQKHIPYPYSHNNPMYNPYSSYNPMYTVHHNNYQSNVAPQFVFPRPKQYAWNSIYANHNNDASETGYYDFSPIQNMKPTKQMISSKGVDGPILYETDEVVNGQRICKTWLYYNGNKYEVVY